MGGTGALVAALGRADARGGHRDAPKTTVAEIVVDGRHRAEGVSARQRRRASAADIVVSNADPMHLYRRHGAAEARSRVGARVKRTSRLSMGLYVLYFGTRRQYPDVAHHTIWLGPRYRELLARHVQGANRCRRISRSTCTGRPRPIRASRRRVATASTCCAPCRTSTRRSTGRSKARSCATASSTRSIARCCRGWPSTITSDFYMTPADFEGPLPQRRWRRLLDRALLHPVRVVPLPQQGARAWRVSTSSARALTPARAARRRDVRQGDRNADPRRRWCFIL